MVITRYSCGFAFDDDLNVALIEKVRPAWQAGKLNGIGGHVEPGENALQCMVREFEEEAGLTVAGWNFLVEVYGEDWACTFFYARGVDLTEVKSMTDERVVVVPALDLPGNVISNLRWLIPLALDEDFPRISVPPVFYATPR